ncbi:Retrovirus-related Pol polyprotein from transposon TNT 1-94 [Cucumis melo var. makuwa]|uniref:Retrovirus-related Pol polyprotein from transposon TNT 1-94 n=1 Tax=Cucumis melo var. makuwa TaxID=1194695 RepID=A0A5D3CS71_CUCMM|nr:Retrovirus-related Pol polyprotein from transposon TNT 1-94 [Cucumis melo var. makuwa]
MEVPNNLGKEKYEINWEMLFVTFKEEAKEMNGEVVAAELVILGFSLGLKEVTVQIAVAATHPTTAFATADTVLRPTNLKAETSSPLDPTPAFAAVDIRRPRLLCAFQISEPRQFVRVRAGLRETQTNPKAEDVVSSRSDVVSSRSDVVSSQTRPETTNSTLSLHRSALFLLTQSRPETILPIQNHLADLKLKKKICSISSVGLAHYYQLHNSLVNLNQDAGQSVNEYLAVLQPIWTQLDQATISKDHLRLIKVLMGLRPEYESVRAALLHRSPLPSLDATIKEILFEERRLGINLSKHSDVVLASTYSPPGASITFCKNCKLTGHKFINCPKIECRYCHKSGHILDNCPIKPPRPRNYSTKAKNFTKPNNSSAAVAPDNSTTPQFQISDLQSLLNHLISSSSSALAVSPGNRWLLDSGCCNHMTSNYSFMNTPSPTKSLPPIYAADDNCMNIIHMGTINTPSLNLPHTYCVPNLTFNLVSVGQLCDLGLIVSFSSNGCQGTLVQRSCPHTSQQNGRAERKHRHILDSVRALLFSASCPEKFWGEAALTSVYTINRLPSSVLQNISPFERLYGTPPNYSNLKVFGCACFVLLHPHEHTKLEPCAPIFLAMAQNIKHTMFSCLSSFHASFSSPPSFFTDTSIDLFPLSKSTPDNELDQSVPTSATSDQSSISDGNPDPPSDTPPRRSTRVREPPIHLQDYHCFSTIVSFIEPTSYQEASIDPLWQKAMNDELQALEKTHTWDYVDLPPGKRPIGCKWIYKIKTHSDGTIEHYKARLVAKGYSQEYGIDYEEIFAPVARMTSVRSLLAVAVAKQWPLLQMDVKNAFLNGTLSEEVYMKPPPGTSSPPHKVCLLRRALYGLKQAPRAWFATFSSTITQLGFTSSPHDTALFTRHTPQGIVLLLLYVDDMIITGNDPQAISDLQHYLGQHFEMKDLGSLNYFLGLEVFRRSDGYLLSQAKYASDLLARSGITDSNTASTPLIYLTVTRPDIAYAVHIVSQFMAAPRTIHFTAVLRILCYVKGTLGHGLQFSSQSSLVLSGYSDADWAGDPTDRRSTTGYCFYLGDSLLSWRSKKQSVVSRSSTESEYRALADATVELLWLRGLLVDMGVPQQGPTLLHCDNRSAIQIAHNDVFHERTKHIENDCHFIRHHLLSHTLLLQFVSTTEQPADIFIKALPSTRFNQIRTKLKLTATLPP